MKILIITKIRYKQDIKIIQNILETEAFIKITEDTYIGEINNEDYDLLIEKLTRQNNQDDTIIIITLKPKTYDQIIQIGSKIELEEEKYKII